MPKFLGLLSIYLFLSMRLLSVTEHSHIFLIINVMVE